MKKSTMKKINKILRGRSIRDCKDHEIYRIAKILAIKKYNEYYELHNIQYGYKIYAKCIPDNSTVQKVTGYTRCKTSSDTLALYIKNKYPEFRVNSNLDL